MSKDEVSSTVVEIFDEFEDEWGDEGQSTTKVLFDVDGYDEDFVDFVKNDLPWDVFHATGHSDDNGDWVGWCADADKVNELKTEFQKNGFATVDKR